MAYVRGVLRSRRFVYAIAASKFLPCAWSAYSVVCSVTSFQAKMRRTYRKLERGFKRRGVLLDAGKELK